MRIASLFIIVILSLIYAGVAQADIETSLIAHYDFEGLSGSTVPDVSGKGHHGVSKSGLTTTVAPTVVAGPTDMGDAMDFNNSNYVEIPNHADFNVTTAYTLSAWTSVDSWAGGSWAAIFCCADGSWRMSRNNNTNMAAFQSSPNAGGYGPVGITNILTPKRWVHLVGTFNNGVMILYVNGVVDGTLTKTDPAISVWTTDPVTIGAQINSGILRRFWDGQIDEVRMYNRALSAADVQELYEFRGGLQNQKPEVNAGSDRILILPNDSIQLAGSVSDDGVGDPNGYLYYNWAYLSGPGTLQWDPSEFVLNPTITFSYDPGIYTFELYATDGDKENTDTVSIVLNESILGDLDGNNRVDILDLKLFCQEWIDDSGDLADLNSDNRVDMLDYNQLAGNWLSQGPSLVINELLASNSSTAPPDGQGEYDDWIELYNPTDMAIDVAGMYLTDNLNDWQKWQFPTDRPSDTIVPSHGFLLVWADEDIADTPGLHANFELNGNNGDEVGLYDSDGTLLDSVTFGKQDRDISFGRDPDASENWYTLYPTPLGSNTGQSVNLVADTKFSIDRGMYENPVQVEITCATEGATIFYTTNFEEPEDTLSATNLEYVGPITIDSTTCLRAKAFKTDWKPSNTDTHTYIFLNDVIKQDANPPGFPSQWITSGGSVVTAEYGMDPDVIGTFDSSGDPNGGDLFGGNYAATIKDDLKSIPTMSLVMEMEDVFGTSGIYANPNGEGIEWERPGSVELIYPDSATAPDDGFQVNCGVRIYGGVGRNSNFEKKAFRVLFKGIYGPTKLSYDLFGNDATDEFDTIILRGGFNNTWHRHVTSEEKNAQYIRHEWASRAQLAMGHPSLHGTFVHLYVNGLYWGLYHPVERANADFAQSYLGGEQEDYDALNSYPATVVDGNASAWVAAQNIANAGVSDTAGYEAIRQYIDVDNLIDYMLLNFYAGNKDWDDHNWYAVRRREDGQGWKHICWDSERILENPYENNHGGTASGNVAIPNMDISNKASHILQALRQNTEFRVRFGDRVHKHLFNNGVLTPTNAAALFMELSTIIDRAIVGESARWGDSSRTIPYTRDGEWIAERDRLLNDYFPVRTDHILNILINAGLYPSVEAPVFNINGSYQYGGSANVGDALSMDNLNGSGTIYFTFDGTDPRLPAATAITMMKLVSENATKKFHVPTVELLDDWTGGAEPFDDSGWNEIASDNMALDFDGTNDYVEINKTASELGINGANPKSITAWVYTRSFNNGGIWDMGSYANGQNFSLRTLGTDNNWRVQYFGSAFDIDFTYDSLNKWVHFALVYDGTGSVLYADGVHLADGAEGLNTSDAGTLKIGLWRTSYFDGVIDDVQAYDQALDLADVQLIMNLGTCAKTPVSRWQLDETSGTVVYDSVGTNNGDLIGFGTDPTWVSTEPVAGPSGIGYENNPTDAVNFADLIDPNGVVQAEMYNTMTSCYLRIPFTLNTDPSELNFITLKARYDDGFVAFINGEYLTLANFSDPPLTWNDTSNGQNSDSLARELETFKVTRDMNPDVFDALQLGDNILAVQGLNASLTSSDFLISVELYAGNEVPTGEVVSPTAVEYVDPNTLTHSALVKARVLDGSTWSALNQATYGVGDIVGSLRITELMYHPADPNTEFIELQNIGAEAINLNLVHFTDGIDFTFGDVTLASGGYTLVVENQAAFKDKYGTGLNIAGQYTGSLDNGGEEIVLRDALGTEIHDFNYTDGWYDLTDGQGFSLTLINPDSTDPNDWDSKSGWRTSLAEGGTPGGTDMVLAVDSIVINELLAHSHAGAPDWIELRNTTNQDINISGWFLSDDNTDPNSIRKYEIPANTVVPKNDYYVFYENTSFGSISLPQGKGFGLSEGGETVYLYSGNAGEITGYYQTEENFDASETDISFGRYEKAELSGGYDFTRMASKTNTIPNTNSGPLIPDIVITEIYYNPPSGGAYEFVELYNRSGSDVTLMSEASTETSPGNFTIEQIPWRLEGTGFEFPAGTTIPAHTRILVAKTPALYSSAPCVVYGPYDGALDNSGEQIEIQTPGDLEYGRTRYWIPIEKIDYDDAAPWQTSADGGGDSLHRLNVDTFGRDYSNWSAAAPTPGQ